eukprot:284817268_2
MNASFSMENRNAGCRALEFTTTGNLRTLIESLSSIGQRNKKRGRLSSSSSEEPAWRSIQGEFRGNSSARKAWYRRGDVKIPRLRARDISRAVVVQVHRLIAESQRELGCSAADVARDCSETAGDGGFGVSAIPSPTRTVWLNREGVTFEGAVASFGFLNHRLGPPSLSSLPSSAGPGFPSGSALSGIFISSSSVSLSSSAWDSKSTTPANSGSSFGRLGLLTARRHTGRPASSMDRHSDCPGRHIKVCVAKSARATSAASARLVGRSTTPSSSAVSIKSIWAHVGRSWESLIISTPDSRISQITTVNPQCKQQLLLAAVAASISIVPAKWFGKATGDASAPRSLPPAPLFLTQEDAADDDAGRRFHESLSFLLEVQVLLLFLSQPNYAAASLLHGKLDMKIRRL